MKHLIIGGVAGGATVAARLRRLSEEDSIILFERGKYVSYANCGLPYYIGDVIHDRNKLFVQTVKGFIDRYKIDIRVEQEVVSINPDKKTVDVKKLSTGEVYTESYDKLVLSPGAYPMRPPIEGIESKKIFTLRNVPDADNIKAYIKDAKPKNAIIIGCGFIGLEMAENLVDAGVHVDLVEMAPQVLAPLDYGMAAIVHQHLISKNIGLQLSDAVVSFEEKDNSVILHLKSGITLTTDMVILSIGVRPDNHLAKDAGLSLGTSGGTIINQFMQTSDPDIYALGDAVEVTQLVTGRTALIPLAGPANKQGRIVATNMILGNQETYEGSIGTAIAKIFDLTIATSGVNSRQLDQAAIPYKLSYIHGSSHAGYYPGSKPLTIEILFSPANGQLLGAQIVGYAGVDARINMMSEIIRRHGTIYDLMKIEHAYAPPYSSAKDPVNVAGFVADNILTGKVHVVQWYDIATLPEDVIKIDVRTADEYELGSIPGSLNIPLDSLRDRLGEIPRDRPIVVNCASGLRSYLACRILSQNGFDNVRNLSGGYKTWHIATAPIISPMELDEKECCAAAPASVVPTKIIKVDACGLMCPGPIMQLKNAYATLQPGEELVITASDPGFAKDVVSWCNMTGAKLDNVDSKNAIICAKIFKGEPKTSANDCKATPKDNKTLIVFSDDLDKALASFVIANGAASTGKKVTMFFTFWGLNVIKKVNKPDVQKDMMGRMFGWMLPSSSEKLKLSKMNMMGMGTKMMRSIMNKKHIDSLESLRQQAIENGVEMIACTMSMDVMGVKKEELLDNVILGGVATYLERTEEANLNLFV